MLPLASLFRSVSVTGAPLNVHGHPLQILDEAKEGWKVQHTKSFVSDDEKLICHQNKFNKPVAYTIKNDDYKWWLEMMSQVKVSL